MERPARPERDVVAGDPLSGVSPAGDPSAPASPAAPGAHAAAPPGAAPPPAYPAAPPAPEPPAPQWVLADWWQRFAALVLDGIIVGVAAAVLIAVITAVAGGIGFLGGEETGFAALVAGLAFGTLVVAVVALLYAPGLMARTNGRTLGKQALGIRVVRANGEPTTFGWSLVREVLLKQLVFGGFLGLGTGGIAWLADGLWPLWDGERRALHDLPVDSRVVRG